MKLTKSITQYPIQPIQTNIEHKKVTTPDAMHDPSIDYVVPWT